VPAIAPRRADAGHHVGRSDGIDHNGPINHNDPIDHNHKVSANDEEPISDSPRGWVARHVRSYLDSDGRHGHRWSGVDTLLITTRGRRTGKLRRTALIYGRDGDRYLVVASNGGSAAHPEWYLNLEADPIVEIQVGAERLAGQARAATTQEKASLWPQMTSIWPDYVRYQAGTSRDIPVVIIEPA
jgi:deazaflavin-dependent oxidoreductase (nitroreductase family)